MAHVGANAAAFWELAGDGEQALHHGEQVAEIGRELGLSAWELNGQIHMRRGQAMLDPTAELVEQLDADAALLASFAPLGAGLAHLQAAVGWLDLDDHGRATKSLDAMREGSRNTGLRYLDAEELRVRASMLTGEDRLETLVQAAEIGARQRARRFQLRALCDLAETEPTTVIDAGPVAKAVTLVRSSFPELDADPDCERAAAIISPVDA